MKRAILWVPVLLLAFTTAALADAVTLHFKSEKGKILKYSVTGGGSIDADLNELPFPGSTVTAKNVKASLSLDTYLKTDSVAEDEIAFTVRGKLGAILLGNLLQLPTDIFGDMMQGLEPNLTLGLSPVGKITHVEMNTQGLPMPAGKAKGMMGGLPGMDGMGLDTVLPMLTSLLPPIFPDNPLNVGDTWKQEIKSEDMPLPILPKIAFNFTLDAVDGDTAVISFTSKGDYDGSFLNSLLAMVPEIPMGADSMKIQKIGLTASWDTKGQMHFNVKEGRVEDLTAHSDVTVDAGGDILMVHPDKSKEPWKPTLNLKIGIDGKMLYQGLVTPADYNTLFPAPAPEKPATKEKPGKKPTKPGTKKKPASST